MDVSNILEKDAAHVDGLRPVVVVEVVGAVPLLLPTAVTLVRTGSLNNMETYKTAGSAYGVVVLVAERFPADTFEPVEGELHEIAQVELPQRPLPQMPIHFH